MNRLSEIRKNPDTERAGFKWTDEEDKELLDHLQKGMEYDKIAGEHHRTENGVKTRIMELHIKKVLNQEMTMDEASALIRVPMDVLEAFRRRFEKKLELKETKREKASVKTNTPNDSYSAILTEIRDYLKILVDKKSGKN